MWLALIIAAWLIARGIREVGYQIRMGLEKLAASLEGDFD